jgi:hypothetical protein
MLILFVLQHLLLHDNRLRSVPLELVSLTRLITLRLDGEDVAF